MLIQNLWCLKQFYIIIVSNNYFPQKLFTQSLSLESQFTPLNPNIQLSEKITAQVTIATVAGNEYDQAGLQLFGKSE